MKHLHMTLALISVVLFTVRFALMLKGSDLLSKKWLKIAPHVIDSLLLVVGVGLAVQLSVNPFEQLWFAEKLFAIVAYIFTAMYAFKYARNRLMQVIGYFGAMGWVLLVVRIAMTKENILF